MTSTSTIGMAATSLPARTVRDVIAQQPELVNEVWCRKIFRHILLALERHHALHLPHAHVSPDTVAFDAAGDAILLPPEQGEPEPGEAADVQALGELVHYAITREPDSHVPLHGRAPGYSESLVGAVDKCIAPDPARRPQTINELRNLLGIVVLGPVVPAAAPAPQLVPENPLPFARRSAMGMPGKWQRWFLIGLACLLLLAAAAALVVLLHGPDPDDDIVLTLPKTLPPAKALDPKESLVHPQAPVHAPPALPVVPAPQPPATTPAPAPAPSAAAKPEAAGTAPAPRPGVPAPASEKPAAHPAPARNPRAGAQRRETTYKLVIKPWGTVYVDGAERGVSPPLKKLTLPAGRHTLRIDNPNYRGRVIRIEAGKRASGRIDVDFSARSR